MRHFSRHMYDLVVTGDVTNDTKEPHRIVFTGVSFTTL